MTIVRKLTGFDVDTETDTATITLDPPAMFLVVRLGDVEVYRGPARPQKIALQDRVFYPAWGAGTVIAFTGERNRAAFVAWDKGGRRWVPTRKLQKLDTREGGE